MQITVNSIQKGTDEFAGAISDYKKMAAKFAAVRDETFFNANIARAQSTSAKLALKAYDEAYLPRLSGYVVALDERGQELDSVEFASMLKDKSSVSFFLCGAYWVL